MRPLLAQSSLRPIFQASSSLSRCLTPAAVARSQQRAISTINPDEVSHFANLAATWWDEQGDLNVLQRMNKVRVEFLRDRLITASFGKPSEIHEKELEKLNGPKFLDGLKVLDVGCGGGLFAERLARLGANTLAIDASNENVQTATLHASQDPSLLKLLEQGQLEYRHAAAEHLLEAANAASASGQADANGQFDIVCAMEVIEHVSDPPSFLRCLSGFIKPGGHLILSTISRTPLSNLLLIQLAESALLRFAPPGSHTYSQFIKPEELASFVRNELGWHPTTSGSLSGHLTPDQKSSRHDLEVRGTTYLPWKGEWTLLAKDDPGQGVVGELRKSCNYFFGARKPL